MNWKHALKDYTIYLKLERGLSKNSIQSYTMDIEKLMSFLDAHAITTTPILIDKNTVQQFIYEIAKVVNPRSQARIISGLKSFFNYLIFEDYRKDNPLDLIESPKIGRKLPDTLSENEIDKLIGAIDLISSEGERNRAMLETLYGCG
ncbi:MAG: site-specific integrase, partial [Maribacter sp.]|nr:site-specific integrase [Maribacter sp.]